ncbi:MAG: DNRLRE domain-containing protein [Chloroflexi bacterium]|nr:DNRLRE domain-containing protein [Chloroflexota bacterium]
MHKRRLYTFFLGLLTLSIGLLSVHPSGNEPPAARADATLRRRVNVPYNPLGVSSPSSTNAIFWFGQVTPTANYADVRMIYSEQELHVTLHIFDRQIWYDTSPADGDLLSWDATALYLDLAGPVAVGLSSTSYRFVAQLNHWEPRSEYQAVYQGSASGWVQADLDFSTVTGWRGVAPNSPEDARGWVVTYSIPFASLGLSRAPREGTEWKLALAIHDRDDAAGTPITPQTWPETTDFAQLSSWGGLHFGIPRYIPPRTISIDEVIVRHGLNGAVVEDAPVGGHTLCGHPFSPSYFPGWGSAVHQKVYTPVDQFNIQNQWDVADWPCYSKFYVTFPLHSIPPHRAIVSATLTLHQFGNTFPTEATPSEIQILSIGEAWQEGTITWNNAPLATENGLRTTVYPLASMAGWPGIPYSWDVSREVAQAYASGQPLRLALYSADGTYHAGKYFSSSEAGEWNEVARPTLTIRYGIEVAPATYEHNIHLPYVEAGP